MGLNLRGLFITSVLALLTTAVFSQTPADQRLRKALEAGDFARVELLAQVFEREYAEGSLTGDDYFNRLKEILPEKAPKSWEPYLVKWHEDHPNSYVASLALGLFYEDVAWQLRGNKYAKDTTSEQFVGFEEYEKKARAELEASLSLSAKPYPTYCELIHNSFGTTDGRREKYFRAALQVDPHSLSAWHLYMTSLQPRWGGSAEQMKALLAEANQSQLRDDEKRHLTAIEYTLQAEAAADAKRYDEAVYLYQSAYQAMPESKNVWRLMRAAETAKDGGLTDLAIALYGKVLDRAGPGNLNRAIGGISAQ